MRYIRPILLLLGLSGLVSSPPAGAQARPSPAQVEAILQSRPELINQLRERIATSGMTPAQIRARLRAEGYPESLLDAYLGSGSGAASSAMPGTEVFDAVRALGIVDDEDAESLLTMAGLDRGGRRASARLTLADKDSTLSRASGRIFGLDLFRSQTTQFLPNVDGPVDAGYRIGPGDELVLILTGEVEAAYNLPVTREGFIVIPDVGQVSVNSLTLGQLEDLLYARLGRVYSSIRRGANAPARFTVSVAKLRSNQVFVTGDVLTPGAQRVSSAGTALTALYAAGGPSDNGSLRRIMVRRGGAVVAELDLYDYLLRGDATNDVRLQQGDVLFVPVHGPRVRVDGAITRPATYETKPGETLADVLSAAGGLRAGASGRRVVIERILPPSERAAGGADRVVMDVPLGEAGAAPSVAMADGDVVRVPGIADRVRNRIVVEGHVWSPGMQGFSEDLTLEQALRRAGGLKPDAYLSRVLVTRLRPDSTRVQLRASLADTTGAMGTPFPLEADDRITVYSRTEFRPERFVAIGGAVRDGGRFPWHEGMSLRDLVLQAGGLDESAYLREAEIARLPDEPSTMVTASTVRVPLDSSYLFDRGAVVAGGPDVTLRPYDNVLIHRDPTWREPATVTITGEVRFPGPYTLTSRSERLSALIGRAGGLTEVADPRATYFARLLPEGDSMTVRLDSLTARADAMRLGGGERPLYPRRGNDSLSTLAERSALEDERRLAFREPDTTAAGDTVETRRRIRVGVDLARAMRGGRNSDDLMLEDGDSIHVSRLRQTVSVRGEVNAPTALAHEGGQSLAFYMRAAGGASQGANPRSAYVIQPNGKVESRRHFLYFFRLDPTPLPGATVIVPARDPEYTPPNLVAAVGLAAQVIASLATIIIVARQ